MVIILNEMIMENEIWKNIIGYDGDYQVSNLGSVRSFKVCRGVSFRILKPVNNKNGYPMVILSKNGKTKTRKIHHLVAESFLNHSYKNHNLIIDHIDNDKKNAKLNNLQLISQRQNKSKTVRGKSKYVGVSINPQTGKWQAIIYVKPKNRALGSYLTEIEAHKAYQKALEKLNKGECYV